MKEVRLIDNRIIRKEIEELDPIPEGFAVAYYQKERPNLVCYPRRIAEALKKELSKANNFLALPVDALLREK